jgi:hypothetical protein
MVKSGDTSVTGVDGFSALPVVERCYAVLGDAAKATYLNMVNELVWDNTQDPSLNTLYIAN